MVMGTSRKLTADLLIDAEVSPADADALAEALDDCGVAAAIKVVAPRRTAEQLQWLVLLAVPLQAFLSAAGEKAGQEAYARVRAAVGRLLGRAPVSADTDTRAMVLADDETGLQIVLTADLPPEGYRQLLELSLDDYTLGPLHYDRHARRWRSIADEVARR
jgi:hypothetical protein